MSKNIFEVYTANPSTSLTGTDLFYFGISPYGITDDSAILWSNVMSSITTVGTISFGTWNGSIIAGQFGGTGVANTGLTINLASGAVGKVLASDVSGNASWSALSSLGVTSITGTANQVFANGTSGTPQTGAITLTLPQNIDTTATPTFNTVTAATASDGFTVNDVLGAATFTGINFQQTGTQRFQIGQNNASGLIVINGNTTSNANTSMAFLRTVTKDIIIPGNVGIGIAYVNNNAIQTLPTYLFSVGTNGSEFGVNASGVIHSSALTASQAVVTDASKNLISLAYSATGGTSNLVSRDANGNTFANNFTSATTSNAASGSPINLNANATRLQITTGTGTQTYKLANATQLNLGSRYDFNNNTTGVVTINDNSNALVTTVQPGGYKFVYVTNIGSPAGTWDVHTIAPNNVEWGTAYLSIPATSYFSGGQLQLVGTSSGIISILPQAVAGTFNFNLPTTAGSSGQFLTSAGGGSNAMTWTTLSSVGVTSITGTANQITASASIGAVTLSFPNGLSIGSYQATSPPTGGLIVPGQVAFGSTGAGTAQLLVDSSLAQGFALQGTNTAATTQIGFYATTKFRGSNPGVIGISIYSNPVFGTSVGNTLTSASCYTSSPDYSNNLGTITVSYGFYHDGGNALPGGTLTTAYGAYFKVPVAGTSKIALYADNTSIGFSGTVPPSNGIIISGQTGLGISSLDSASLVTSTIVNFRRAFYVGGTSTATAGFDTYASFYSIPTWSPSAGNSNYICDFVANSRFVAPSAQTLTGVIANYYSSLVLNSNVGTITNAFGFFCDGGSSATGTVTTNYSAYFANPNGGTNRHALHADNISIGSSYVTSTTPPTNGAIIQGRVGINQTGPLALLHVGNSSLASSNYLYVEATNAVDKGIAWVSSGAIRAYMILPGGNQNFLQITTGVQAIGIDLINNTTMIGTGTALNRLDVNGAAAIGSYAGTATLPANTCASSGGFISGSGTAGAPGFTFFVDNTAGMYYTSNTINFSTSSTARASISSSGIVINGAGLLYTDTGTSSGGTLHHAFRTTGSSLRVAIGLQNTETGSNAGSNFNIYTYKDDTSFLGNPLTIIRSTGTVGLSTGSAANTASVLHVSSTTAYGGIFNGTQTLVDGSTNSAGIYINPTLNPTNGSTISAGVYSVPVIATPTGKTIVVACGNYTAVDTGSNVGVINNLIGHYFGLGNLTVNGTIQSAYQIYVSQPLASATGNYYAASIQGGIVFHRTATATDYTVKTSDTIVGVTSTAAARTITLPSTVTDASFVLIVKDESGGAATNNITVARNGHNIDGAAANKTINTNYGVLRLYSDGTNYFTW